MKLYVRGEVWRAALLATLGVSQVACGGKSFDSDTANGGTSNSGGTGGHTSSGGASHGGTVASGSGGYISGGGDFASGAWPATGGSGGVAGAGGVAGQPNYFPCNNPMPITDEDTGFYICDNGVVVRNEIMTCPTSVPRPEPIDLYDPNIDQCQYDSDCTGGLHGYCATPVYQGGPDIAGRMCNYGCVSDDECGAGSVCQCGELVGQCVAATCLSSADCQAGYLCAIYDAEPGCGYWTYACQTPYDTCFSMQDCNSNVDGNSCISQDGVTRSCGFAGCAIGRPFLVEDVARVAGLRSRSDWLDKEPVPALEHLTLSERAKLAHDFSLAGQLEHASIAAFARFALELLALGAPPELLAKTTEAMSDERRHARLCFGLASAYAGRAIGPDALSIDGALGAVTLERSVVTALREGCVGETVAALEATELSLRASDPCLRSALSGIAADERRHADLAWQFVAWALDQGDPRVLCALRTELESLRCKLPRSASETASMRASSETDDAYLAELGILPESLRAAVRAEAVREVIIPALVALLERAPEEPIAA